MVGQRTTAAATTTAAHRRRLYGNHRKIINLLLLIMVFNERLYENAVRPSLLGPSIVKGTTKWRTNNKYRRESYLTRGHTGVTEAFVVLYFFVLQDVQLGPTTHRITVPRPKVLWMRSATSQLPCTTAWETRIVQFLLFCVEADSETINMTYRLLKWHHLQKMTLNVLET